MPNTQDRSFDYLEDMTNGELQQILRKDASKSQMEDTDMELIFHVMEVLAKRRTQRGEGKSPAEALDSFHENYCTNVNKHHNLISESVKRSPKTRNVIVWKRFAATAAVLVLLLGSSLTAKAWSFDLWDVIAQWTKETFHFTLWGEETEPAAPTPDRELPCASLQAALDDYEITQKLVPTWMPDGYVETGVDILETPIQRRITAIYEFGANEILIRISDYLGSDPQQIEQSEDLLEIYKPGDIEYYIFNNNNLLQTVWVNSHFEGYISCSLTLDDIKMMLDSIEKG